MDAIITNQMFFIWEKQAPFAWVSKRSGQICTAQSASINTGTACVL
jgi:hypothetical protein